MFTVVSIQLHYNGVSCLSREILTRQCYFHCFSLSLYLSLILI